jgi:hypothetical protein
MWRHRHEWVGRRAIEICHQIFDWRDASSISSPHFFIDANITNFYYDKMFIFCQKSIIVVQQGLLLKKMRKILPEWMLLTWKLRLKRSIIFLHSISLSRYSLARAWKVEDVENYSRRKSTLTCKWINWLSCNTFF